MRVVLVGGGGREAALAWRIARSESLSELYVTHANPGWPDRAQQRMVGSPSEIVALALEVGAELVIVGPEGPLAAGLGDQLGHVGVPCFGPTRGAARLESSKAFAKEIMAAARVPTAAALVVDCSDPAQVEAAKGRCAQGSVVIKADGLAAGKGVFVCPSPVEAAAALQQVSSGRFGDAAERLVLEDLMEGPEVSVFALCDGERVVALPSAQDHKRLGDGNKGPNTGGMGAYVPCPLVGQVDAAALVKKIHLPVIQEMSRRGTPFRGVLYAGLMITPAGPRVLEFNVRFGDPECQPLMRLWDEDILPWLHGAAVGRLPEGTPRFAEGASCCVVLASAGYPLTSDKGRQIPEPEVGQDVVLFHSGTIRDERGVLRTNGGRVLGLTAVAPSISAARARCYEELPGHLFYGAQYRTDIAATAS